VQSCRSILSMTVSDRTGRGRSQVPAAMTAHIRGILHQLVMCRRLLTSLACCVYVLERARRHFVKTTSELSACRQLRTHLRPLARALKFVRRGHDQRPGSYQRRPDGVKSPRCPMCRPRVPRCLRRVAASVGVCPRCVDTSKSRQRRGHQMHSGSQSRHESRANCFAVGARAQTVWQLSSVLVS
jgi:hypothetical protein